MRLGSAAAVTTESNRPRVLAAVALAIGALVLLGTPALGAERASTPIQIIVNEDGFSPKRLAVRRGQPVTPVFPRETERTCAKDVVIYLDRDVTVFRRLPLNEPVAVRVTFERAGEYGFACSMKMHGAAILVE